MAEAEEGSPRSGNDGPDLDAMGQDKRRHVIGQRYAASRTRQAALYLVFLVVIVALVVGVKLLVDHYDQPPKHFKPEAPWAQPGVKQIPPKPLQ